MSRIFIDASNDSKALYKVALDAGKMSVKQEEDQDEKMNSDVSQKQNINNSLQKTSGSNKDDRADNMSTCLSNFSESFNKIAAIVMSKP